MIWNPFTFLKRKQCSGDAGCGPGLKALRIVELGKEKDPVYRSRRRIKDPFGRIIDFIPSEGMP